MLFLPKQNFNMKFKYSICHPLKKNIEYINHPITKYEVLKIVENYPWKEKLELQANSNNDDIYYSPSLNFLNIENNRSFELTANFDKKNNIEFSLWYNRPINRKILGFIKVKNRMTVSDIWDINYDKSLYYLKLFLNGSYEQVEELYR